MATSNVGIKVNFSGAITYGQQFDAAANTLSPASNEIKDLASGANTIDVPSDATGVTLIPPTGNAVAITLKGISGDTGIALHLTNPTFISLGSSVTSFVLTTGDVIDGFRLIWS